MIKRAKAKVKRVRHKLKLTPRVLVVAGGATVLLLVLFLLIPQPFYREGFETLAQINQHAATLDELRPMEGSNFSRPDFSKYYATFVPTLGKRIKGKITRILRLLHLKKAPLWSSSFFRNLLEEVIAEREKRGWSVKPIVQKAMLDQQSRVVVLGDLQGAFHSLTRDLTELKNLQIIDEQLRVTQQNYFIVFQGNVINRSPYTLETLSIILRLIQRNPDNVIYLKGKNEYYDYWKEHTLRDELKTKTRDQSTKKYSMVKVAQKFFQTLPLGFYGTIDTGQSVVALRISPHGRKSKKAVAMDESTYADFLTAPSQERLATFDLNMRTQGPQPSSERLMVKAIIHGISKRNNYEPTDGLYLLGADDGALAWTFLSCPTQPYRMITMFFFDAFGVIYGDADINQWKIALYNRDTRKTQDLTFKVRWQYLFSGYDEQGRMIATGLSGEEQQYVNQIIQQLKSSFQGKEGLSEKDFLGQLQAIQQDLERKGVATPQQGALPVDMQQRAAPVPVETDASDTSD